MGVQRPGSSEMEEDCIASQGTQRTVALEKKKKSSLNNLMPL
jgi:hypothetical protein